MNEDANQGSDPRAGTGREQRRHRGDRSTRRPAGRRATIPATTIGFTLVLAATIPGWTDSRLVSAVGDSGDHRVAAPVNFESDCRACHDSGLPDRHHLLYGQSIPRDSVVPYPDTNGDGSPDFAYSCLNCHDTSFTFVRNCVACHVSPAGIVSDGAPVTEDPLTVTSSAFGTLSLNWDLSCGGDETDYAVYEGTLGDFATHIPVLCSTEGSTSATIPRPAGSAYYLVIPRNHWSEGSYGLDSNGVQRPPSGAACLSQSIGCP